MKTKLFVNCLIATIVLTISVSAFAQSSTFRVTKADIRTPHFAGSVLGGLMTDLINEEINYNLNEDDPVDGYYDASFLLGIDFNKVTYRQGRCEYTSEKPLVCDIDSNHREVTTSAASVSVPDGSSFTFVTSPKQLKMSLMGIRFELNEPRITFTKDKVKVKSSAKGVIEGSVTGFISMQDAQNIHIPSWVPFIGGWSFAQVFDSDELKTNSSGIVGWWFVLDFEAEQVTMAS